MLLLSLQCWEVADTVLWSRRRTEGISPGEVEMASILSGRPARQGCLRMKENIGGLISLSCLRTVLVANGRNRVILCS